MRTPKFDSAKRQPAWAAASAQGSDALARQIESVAPVIRGVIRRRFASGREGDAREAQWVEDAYGDTVCQLITRLSAGTAVDAGTVTGNAAPSSVRDFAAFAAATASHVCDAYLRRRYPARARLKRRLLYVLEGQGPGGPFAAWFAPEGQRLCGLVQWRDRPVPSRTSERYLRLLDAPESFFREISPHGDAAHLAAPDLLRLLFAAIGHAVALDDVARACARLWNIRDDPDPQAVDEETATPGFEPPLEDLVLQREYLRTLWAEIRELPPPQATALLLNLRGPSGEGLIALLPITRTASMDEIAGAMSMAPTQLAAIWNGLPLDDLTIANTLECTRQQVINLRRAARSRLERRMHGRWPASDPQGTTTGARRPV
ncbi:MAG TPA: hypothetical protein VK689_11630 [Armatimonadota bacterium]|nr:hypothetical protein [Armatimonadota bacterium]